VRAETDAWTQPIAPPAPGQDDWVVTNTVRSLTDDGEDAEGDSDTGSHPDDGTPVEGVTPASPTGTISSENAFVAGEIDVPTPPPEGKTPQVEFTAASTLLGNTEPSDPDTGSRTPPLQRKSGS
jgi:hypothetical protein